MAGKVTSIPIKLLHEGEGHTVSVELKTGEIYRGYLSSSEENMNLQMTNITLTARDGKVTRLEQVYLRGSQIRFIVLPDMLKKASMFKRVQAAKKGKEKDNKAKKGGRGRGKK